MDRRSPGASSCRCCCSYVGCCRPDPGSMSTLLRILQAGHHAPSVGFMQPWNFILISDRNLRARVHAAFERANAEAKALFAGARAERYAALKLEGILES